MQIGSEWQQLRAAVVAAGATDTALLQNESTAWVSQVVMGDAFASHVSHEKG